MVVLTSNRAEFVASQKRIVTLESELLVLKRAITSKRLDVWQSR